MLRQIRLAEWRFQAAERESQFQLGASTCMDGVSRRLKVCSRRFNVPQRSGSCASARNVIHSYGSTLIGLPITDLSVHSAGCAISAKSRAGCTAMILKRVQWLFGRRQRRRRRRRKKSWDAVFWRVWNFLRNCSGCQPLRDAACTRWTSSKASHFDSRGARLQRSVPWSSCLSQRLALPTPSLQRRDVRIPFHRSPS